MSGVLKIRDFLKNPFCARFAIFVGFIKLYSRLDYLYLYYLVYIQALN